MKTVLARRLIAVACMGAFAVIGSACMVTVPPLSGGTGNACPAGTWNLTGETIGNSLQTVLGSATVTGSGSGVTLTLAPTNAWNLTANQNLTISGTGFSVNAMVKNATASGTYTTSGSNITFTLQNLSGTVTVSGMVGGQSFSQTFTLGQSDDIQKLYGLTGTASFTCNGSLTLSTPAAQMDFGQ
jgi:hypothetical protein